MFILGLNMECGQITDLLKIIMPEEEKVEYKVSKNENQETSIQTAYENCFEI